MFIRGSLDFLLLKVGEGPKHGHPLLQSLECRLPGAKFTKKIFEVSVPVVDIENISSVSVSF